MNGKLNFHIGKQKSQNWYFFKRLISAIVQPIKHSGSNFRSVAPLKPEIIKCLATPRGGFIKDTVPNWSTNFSTGDIKTDWISNDKSVGLRFLCKFLIYLYHLHLLSVLFHLSFHPQSTDRQKEELSHFSLNTHISKLWRVSCLTSRMQIFGFEILFSEMFTWLSIEYNNKAFLLSRLSFRWASEIYVRLQTRLKVTEWQSAVFKVRLSEKTDAPTQKETFKDFVSVLQHHITSCLGGGLSEMYF